MSDNRGISVSHTKLGEVTPGDLPNGAKKWSMCPTFVPYLYKGQSESFDPNILANAVAGKHLVFNTVTINSNTVFDI